MKRKIFSPSVPPENHNPKRGIERCPAQEATPIGKKVPPSVKIEQELYTGLITSGDPLGEAARRGARLILQKIAEAEVEQFLGRGWYERFGDGATTGHRNGYERKKVHCGEGTIEFAVPQIRDTLEPFESVWLKAIGRSQRLLVKIRPTSLLQRLFGGGKRRTETIPKFTTESSGMMLLFAALVDVCHGLLQGANLRLRVMMWSYL